MDIETWTRGHGHGDRDMDMETWRHGHGGMDMVTWKPEDMETWRRGNMEKWTWRHAYKEIETWAWRHGNMETWRQHGHVGNTTDSFFNQRMSLDSDLSHHTTLAHSQFHETILLIINHTRLTTPNFMRQAY
jgi:hypothetical protein